MPAVFSMYEIFFCMFQGFLLKRTGQPEKAALLRVVSYQGAGKAAPDISFLSELKYAPDIEDTKNIRILVGILYSLIIIHIQKQTIPVFGYSHNRLAGNHQVRHIRPSAKSLLNCSRRLSAIVHVVYPSVLP